MVYDKGRLAVNAAGPNDRGTDHGAPGLASSLTGTRGGTKPPRMPEVQTLPPLPSLQVDVSAVRRRGDLHAQVQADLPIAWLAAALSDTDAEVREAGAVRFDLNLPSDGPVIISGTLQTQFVVPCGRCLDDAAVDGGTRIDGMFIVGKAAKVEEHEDDLGLDDDSLDTWTYDGRIVDLAPVVAEYVKVAYPMRALCARGEECQGLCSGCGNPFNETPPRRAGSRAFCVKCDQEFFGPVGEPKEGDEEDDDTSEGSGALAEALKKLKLD